MEDDLTWCYAAHAKFEHCHFSFRCIESINIIAHIGYALIQLTYVPYCIRRLWWSFELRDQGRYTLPWYFCLQVLNFSANRHFPALTKFKPVYTVLSIIYFSPCIPLPTDETLLASGYSIVIFMTDVQTDSQLGPACPCTLSWLTLILFLYLW